MMIDENGLIEEMRAFELMKLIRDGVVVKLREAWNFGSTVKDINPVDVCEAPARIA
jgi:hypothetical protein